MIDKFDNYRNKFFIIFAISILILFFDLHINQFSFFDNLNVPETLEIYIILIVNLYYYYEILATFLLIEKKENLDTKIYKIHFLISTILLIIILVKVLHYFIDFNKAFNLILFSLFSIILSITVFNIYTILKRFLISLKIFKHEVYYNLTLFLINSILLILIIYFFNNIVLFKFYNYIILILSFIVISISNIYYLKKKNYFKNYEDKLITHTNIIEYSPLLELLTQNKSISEIQEQIKLSTLNNPISIYSDIENKLINAIKSGNFDLVKELFQTPFKIDINSQRNNGWTYLHYSVAQGEYDITNFLLENGANPDIKNHIGIYPISFAIRYQNIQIVKLLIEYHANVNLLDINGFSPVFLAIQVNNFELFNILLENGADIKMKCNGFSLMDYAKKLNRGKIVKSIKDISKK